MVLYISILGGLCFATLIYTYIYIKLLYKKRLEMIDWFLLSLATFNGIGFGFVIWATHEGRNPYVLSQLLMNYDISISITYFLLNILLLLSVFWGWYLAKIINLSNLNRKKKYYIVYSEQYIAKKMISVAWLMFFIAVITYWIYSKPYGGFKGLLNYSKAIRAGIFLIENRFSFFKRFGGFAFFSSYLFYGLLIDKKINKNKKKYYFIAFIFSFIFSFYVLYSWAGRASLGVYIATFLLGHILYSYKSVINFTRKIIFLLAISVLLIIFTDAILERSIYKLGIIELFAKELSFPFSTFFVQMNLQNYRWFKDILIAPIYILPSRVWSGLFNIETASSFNTFILLGARKGEAGNTSAIPVDMLSFSLMQASFLGVILVGLLWGMILHWIELLVNKIPIKGIRVVVYANIILNIAVMNVLYGDIHHLIVRNFYIIVGFMVICFFLKINHNKKDYIMINPQKARK